MLDLFWKLAVLIMCINGFIFFVMGSAFPAESSLAGGFSSFPQTFQDQNLTSAGNVSPDGNFALAAGGSNIQPTGSGATNNVPNLQTLLSSFSITYGIAFNLLFGYFIWLQFLLPFPLVLAIGVVLFVIQIFGLFLMVQQFIASIGLALGIFRV